MKKSMIALAALLLALSYSAIARAQTQARADIKGADGTSVGTAVLRESKDGVLITISVKGLPQGLHAVHIHSVGKCDGPAFTSAGPHFNPMNKKHGLKSAEGPHAGDLPDIYVNKAGLGRYEALTESIALNSGEASIFDADGSSIVIHASPDDNMTDPSGNSGDRIACGVIAKATKKTTGNVK